MVFFENLAKINEHNGRLGKTYDLGLNQFAGLTPDEFVTNYLDLELAEKIQNRQVQEVVSDASKEEEPNSSIDWTTQGKVPRVKDQGSFCRAGWAFSVTGAV